MYSNAVVVFILVRIKKVEKNLNQLVSCECKVRSDILSNFTCTGNILLVFLCLIISVGIYLIRQY